MATQPPRWILKAALPASTTDSARLITIEASHRPELGFLDAIEINAPTSWPGRGQYLLRHGNTFSEVAISERCRGGGCGECKPPPEAYIRVVDARAVTTWTLVRSVGPFEERFTADELRRVAEHAKRVRASRPFRVEFAGDQGVSESHTADSLRIFAWDESGRDRVVRWSAQLIMEGMCPDPAVTCEPPASEYLELEGASP